MSYKLTDYREGALTVRNKLKPVSVITSQAFSNEIEVSKLTHGDKGLNPWRLEC